MLHDPAGAIGTLQPLGVVFTPADTDACFDVAIPCPICGYEYVSPVSPVYSDGGDDYRAWAGRGHCLRLPFECEEGHRFVLAFGFHKGQTFAFWEPGD